MEGVDDLERAGENDRVDGRVGGREIEGAEADSLLPGAWSGLDPPSDVGVAARGQDVDDLVVLDIGDGRHEARVPEVVGITERSPDSITETPQAMSRAAGLRQV